MKNKILMIAGIALTYLAMFVLLPAFLGMKADDLIKMNIFVASLVIGITLFIVNLD